tara:strand:- start:176 stop:835 length:660 start_codon:yes stop_codon:yes gene_type:complete
MISNWYKTAQMPAPPAPPSQGTQPVPAAEGVDQQAQQQANQILDQLRANPRQSLLQAMVGKGKEAVAYARNPNASNRQKLTALLAAGAIGVAAAGMTATMGPAIGAIGVGTAVHKALMLNPKYKELLSFWDQDLEQNIKGVGQIDDEMSGTSPELKQIDIPLAEEQLMVQHLGKDIFGRIQQRYGPDINLIRNLGSILVAIQQAPPLLQTEKSLVENAL